MPGENFPLKKGNFWPMGQRWWFFVLINATVNGNIFRVKKSHISLRGVSLSLFISALNYFSITLIKKVVDLDPSSGDVTAVAVVLIQAAILTKSRNTQYTMSSLHRMQYQASFKFCWNIDSGHYYIIDSDPLKEISGYKVKLICYNVTETVTDTIQVSLWLKILKFDWRVIFYFFKHLSTIPYGSLIGREKNNRISNFGCVFAICHSS